MRFFYEEQNVSSQKNIDCVCHGSGSNFWFDRKTSLSHDF